MAVEKNKIKKVFFGGWYQRTTLHLTEIYDFLSEGESSLSLSKEKLGDLHTGLGLSEVTRETGNLEYIRAVTHDGINIHYYEDGLYIFSLESDRIDEAKDTISHYYEEKFSPAIAYIFSLGAPTPKELANIKTTHPIVVSVLSSNPESFPLEEKYGKVYGSISSKELIVKKTAGFIFLITKPEYESSLESLVEMQVFFREFKDQLQRYLAIHRDLWEEITNIKEKKMVKGSEVEKIRLKLDGYQKTINLISSRINQMGAYVHTRADIAKEAKLTEHLAVLFQYKFDVLTNTQSYIKEIWVMTNNYLNAAIQVVNEIKNQATNKSIQSLQIITTYGVVGGIIGYLSRDSLPKITGNGLLYFIVLIIATFAVNKIVSRAYAITKYKLTFTERVEGI